MRARAFAVAAHPDDIEFGMAGTLLLLKDAGYELHYLNIANGSCGTATQDVDAIVRVRRGEAMDAARALGATFHESLVNDIDIFYEKGLLAKVGAIVREVQPEILLVPSPVDYMEDHVNAERLAVTAAFCRGMPNFPTDPPFAPVDGTVTVYHAQPHGNADRMGRRVTPDFFVDIAGVIERKTEVLAKHRSQKEWLDESQGLDSYLHTMQELGRQVGEMSGRFEYAEGWHRHSHLGFCAADSDPLAVALAGNVLAAAG